MNLKNEYNFSTNSNINKLLERSILHSPNKSQLQQADQEHIKEEKKNVYPEGNV